MTKKQKERLPQLHTPPKVISCCPMLEATSHVLILLHDSKARSAVQNRFQRRHHPITSFIRHQQSTIERRAYSSSESESSLVSAPCVSCGPLISSPGSPSLYNPRSSFSCAIRASCSCALMGLFFLDFPPADLLAVAACLVGGRLISAAATGTESLAKLGRAFLQSSQSFIRASLLN
uniref:Uncharacterized protein n=1 Tax=Photinus pyralis TaxID=7054 RepID=A0A1Y1KKD0_PHOPY